MILYIIVFIILLFVMAFGSYIVYDYMKHKKELDDNLTKSNDDINSNFKVTTSAMKYIYNETQDTNKKIDKQELQINKIDEYTSNTSNILANNMNKHASENENTFNSFHNNLNRYFKFNDGNKNINDNTAPNNKIFNYIFGTSIPNMELMTRTTAISGLTINSDVNKELTVCNATRPEICIKLSTDMNSNFVVSPAGTSNILFRNNDNSISANFDTFNKEIYLGGQNAETSALYIKSNDVYVKNLRLISPTSQNANILLNIDTFNKFPIYTICSIKNTRYTPPTSSGNAGTSQPSTLNTIIRVNVYFDSTYSTANSKKLYINIPYVNIQALDAVPSTRNVKTITLMKNNDVSTALSNKITYENNFVFKIDASLNEIPMGYVLVVEVALTDVENLTELSESADFSFATNSYLLS